MEIYKNNNAVVEEGERHSKRLSTRLKKSTSCFLITCFLYACGGAVEPEPEPKPNPANPIEAGLSKACAPEYAGDVSKFAAPYTIRRLSADQYTNVLRKLSGDDQLIVEIDPDPAPEGPVILADHLRVTRQFVQDTEKNAWALAGSVLKKINNKINCDPELGSACFDTLLNELAIEVWRRPIENSERGEYQQLASEIEKNINAEAVAESLVAAFLQSPQFIHRIDKPLGKEMSPGVRQLNDWQLAEALAMFLWRSKPDQTLYELAAQGMLSDDEILIQQVDRMISHPNIKGITDHFISQWLNAGILENLIEDEGNWSAEMAAAVKADSQAVFNKIMLDPETTFTDLFTHNTALISPANAELFGMEMEAGESPKLVEVNPDQRTGVLTHHSFLIANSKAEGSSPIKRGDQILKQIMCVNLDFPSDMEIPPEPEPSAKTPTGRDRLAVHSSKPECYSCHQFIDPPGLALELWDGMGQPRIYENEVAIDASGEISVTGRGRQPFDTPAEMFDLLASSEGVQECFLKRWYDEATGTEHREKSEPCGYEGIRLKTQRNKIPLRELLADLVLHPSFRMRLE